MGIKKQTWVSLDEDVLAELERLADKEQRKVSAMAAILLTNAIKERARKRKPNAKEV